MLSPDTNCHRKVKMSKKQKKFFAGINKVTYDFALDSIIAVDAPIGTDPDALIEEAYNKLAQRIADRDLTFQFENIYDSETGAYDVDWENYSRESENE